MSGRLIGIPYRSGYIFDKHEMWTDVHPSSSVLDVGFPECANMDHVYVKFYALRG